MSNMNLKKAKDAQNDEFYTQREDVENELNHYIKDFKGKAIFCNCDDYQTSQFYAYFRDNFMRFGLKELTSIGYSYDVAYKATVSIIEDKLETKITMLTGNGDFMSKESIAVLKRSDIVITNPPFSLFRSLTSLLNEYHKDYILLGNLNACVYADIFPQIMDSKINLGYNSNSMKFSIPDGIERKDVIVDSQGRRFIKLGNVCWFTSLQVNDKQPLSLTASYNKLEYPTYDNFNAINVNRIKDIPKDYYGVMGVPITILTKYSHNQFEIVGSVDSRFELILKESARRHACALINGKRTYQRIFIQRTGSKVI